MLHLMDLRGVAMGAKSWRVVKIPYTRLEEEETLIENDSIFCESTNFGVKQLRVRTVEIRNFTRIRQKIL